MIIRNDVQRTLKASPLNNRSVRRTCGQLVTAGRVLRTTRLLSVDAFSVQIT